MKNIENNTHYVEFIKTKGEVIARKYSKLEVGMLWEKDYYLDPETYETTATYILVS